MDYRKIAEEFCSIRALSAKRMTEVENSVSARGEASVLLFLSQTEGEVLAGQIARSLELSASRGTNILNSLEKKGLVQRRSDSRDKRKVYISLTQEGRALLKKSTRKQSGISKGFSGSWDRRIQKIIFGL